MTNIDWVCSDCGIVYCAPADDGRRIADTERFRGTAFGTLPEMCPECGEHYGWEKRNDSLE
jgi:rubredoxin